MFCTYCGKEIINSARFCNFCGNPVRNITMTSTSATEQSYSAPVPETNAAGSTLSGDSDAFAQSTAETSLNTAHEFSETGAAETEASVFETSQTNAARETPAVDTSPAADRAYPMPNVIPQSGFGVSEPFSAPVKGAENTPAAAPSKPERERKYTLGHILLCLAATAVMAITAGVFAGLYFSVV